MTITIFIISIVVYVLAGIFIARKVKNSDDFFVMGERGSTLLIVGTLAATYLSAVTLLGISGISYAEGPLVIAATGSFGAWIGTLLAIIYVGRNMKALGCKTMPDFFRERFRNKTVTSLATIIMIIGLLGYGVIQLIGAGLLIEELTGINFALIIIIFVIALLAFSLYGGMYGVVVTDTIMFFIMIAVSAIVAPWLIHKAGFTEMKSLSNTLEGYWTLAGTQNRPLSFTFSQFLVWIVFFTCTPALVSRVFPAKNDFVILKSTLIGVFLAAFMQIPIFLAASGMQVIQPGIEQTDSVMIIAFLEHVPSVLGGIGLAALMAAIMSTTSTLFVIAGFGLSRDLYQNLKKETISEKKLMKVNRIAQLIIGAIVAGIAISRPAAIYWISIYAGALFGVGWLPSVIAGLEWKRMNHKAAITSMVLGVLSFICITELEKINLITLPNLLDPLMMAFLISVVSLIFVALITKPNNNEVQYYYIIKNTKPSGSTIKHFLARENGLSELKKECLNVKTLIAVVVLLAFALWGFLFYKLGL
ncbi:sodium:solute symporter family protein [Aestuariivivens sediminis]|uniref:sodium:solute symporter family protein n=1 Tax=Aestuariivivens sediminis TaxID=2913557 RepID=UPI001F571BCD|nr:sodium:solute symporter family protein [Aestuariivivens sediminis]